MKGTKLAKWVFCYGNSIVKGSTNQSTVSREIWTNESGPLWSRYLKIHPAGGEDWFVAVVVEHHVDPGPGGRVVAVVVGLHVQQDSQPVVFSTENSLAKLHLQLTLLCVCEVGGVEVNLTSHHHVGGFGK